MRDTRRARSLWFWFSMVLVTYGSSFMRLFRRRSNRTRCTRRRFFRRRLSRSRCFRTRHIQRRACLRVVRLPGVARGILVRRKQQIAIGRECATSCASLYSEQHMLAVDRQGTQVAERLRDGLNVVAGFGTQHRHARPGPAVGVAVQGDRQKHAQARTLEAVQVLTQCDRDLHINGMLGVLAQAATAAVEDLDHGWLLFSPRRLKDTKVLWPAEALRAFVNSDQSVLPQDTKTQHL